MNGEARPSRWTLGWSLLGLAGFLALQGLLLNHFIRIDTRPPSWDQADQLEIALDYRQALGQGHWEDAWHLAAKPGMPPFPPGYGLLLRGAYDWPDPAHAALWYNWIYFALLIVSIFGIAWRFLPDSRALAAAVAFGSAPVVQELCTTQLVDISVVAFTAAAYWALLASESFTLWLPSLAFAALFAAGMLHKWSFFTYFLPALLVGARALSDGASRWKAIFAAALSLALFGPWYWSHALLLPSKLIQASTDAGVPFWEGAAWTVYLVHSCGALGPLLWGLGLLGLLSPEYRRRLNDGWLLAAWIATSVVFWTIVPNRQMRYVLPGLIPLGIAFGTWPGWMVWAGTLLQLFGGVNAVFGWFGPKIIPAARMNLVFFQNRPPAREDWEIPEILRRVEADRDPTRPLSNVTLVANDSYFNGPTLHWHQRWLGLSHVRVRGVNRRLCELSEFVLLKEGRLGPESVINGLPEAAAQIRNPKGWFQAAYEPVGRWPLPDGSAAVLYRQRRHLPRPVAARELSIPSSEIGAVRITGLHASFGPWDPARSLWTTARLNAKSVEIRGLAVRDVQAEVENFSFLPFDLRLLRLDKIKITGLRIEAGDLKNFLEKRIPGLALDRVVMDQTIRAEGRWHGRPISAEAALQLEDSARRLRVRVLSVRYAETPIPAALFRPIKELNLSLAPNPETPFFVSLAGLSVKNGRLTVP